MEEKHIRSICHFWFVLMLLERSCSWLHIFPDQQDSCTSQQCVFFFSPALQHLIYTLNEEEFIRTWLKRAEESICWKKKKKNNTLITHLLWVSVYCLYYLDFCKFNLFHPKRIYNGKKFYSAVTYFSCIYVEHINRAFFYFTCLFLSEEKRNKMKISIRII